MFKINLSRYKIAKMNALKVRTESKFKNVHLICLKIDFNKLITAWLIQSKEKFGEQWSKNLQTPLTEKYLQSFYLLFTQEYIIPIQQQQQQMEKAKKGTQLHKQIALWLLEQKHELPQQLINFLHKIIDQERKRLGPHKLIVQNGIGYGIMDCALISEKDATIIDWKTGSWKKKQLEHYALGLKSEHAKIMVIDPLKFKVDQWSVNPSLLTKQYQDFWSYKLVGTKLKGKALREIFDRIQKKKENDWARWLFTVPPEQLAKMTDGKKLQQFIQRYWFEAEMRGQYQYKDKLHNFEKQGDIAGLMKHLNIK